MGGQVHRQKMISGEENFGCMLEHGPMPEDRTPNRTNFCERTGVDGIGPVVVTGSSGLIGTAVCQSLRHCGHEVRRLVRREPERDDEYRWDPDADVIDAAVFSGARSVVHLAGAPVATRWTKTMKNRIHRSRVGGTRQIHAAASRVFSVRTLVCASAIGFYGFDPSQPAASESTGSGDGFLAEVCRAWEESARTAISGDSNAQLTIARIGVVLDVNGGMLSHLLACARRLGRIPIVGSGEQLISWVSLNDCVESIRFCLANEISGPVNIVSPNTVSQRELAENLADRIGMKTVVIPSLFIRCTAGRMGQEVILGGRRVGPTRLVDSGYPFANLELGSFLDRLHIRDIS
ncbi:MAG: TIGR01777 family oxidoreductase [Phycisphaerales bacterium]